MATLIIDYGRYATADGYAWHSAAFWSRPSRDLQRPDVIEQWFKKHFPKRLLAYTRIINSLNRSIYEQFASLIERYSN